MREENTIQKFSKTLQLNDGEKKIMCMNFIAHLKPPSNFAFISFDFGVKNKIKDIAQFYKKSVSKAIDIAWHTPTL